MSRPPSVGTVAAAGSGPPWCRVADLIARRDDWGAGVDVVVVGADLDRRRADLLDALGDADAVAAIEPLTDALKEVDDHGTVTAALDRSAYGYLGCPQALRARALWAALQGLDPETEVNPAAVVLAHGGSVRALRMAGR